MSSASTRTPEDSLLTTLTMSTTYFHNKIQPFLFWQRDIVNRSNMFVFKLAYEHDHHWKFTLGALYIDGNKVGWGAQGMEHKNSVYFTTLYRF
jgi:hypothetical protein